MIRKILLICSFSEEETLSPKASSRQFHSHLISHMLKLQRLEKAKEEEELSNIKDVVTTVIHQSVHHCSMGIIIIIILVAECISSWRLTYYSITVRWSSSESLLVICLSLSRDGIEINSRFEINYQVITVSFTMSTIVKHMPDKYHVAVRIIIQLNILISLGA